MLQVVFVGFLGWWAVFRLLSRLLQELRRGVLKRLVAYFVGCVRFERSITHLREARRVVWLILARHVVAVLYLGTIRALNILELLDVKLGRAFRVR